jgi:hypothetical protein
MWPRVLWYKIQLTKVEVKLRPIVSLGVRHPSGTRDQFLILLEIFFRQLQVSYFVVPSLTIGLVCNLLLLLDLASAVPLESESCRTQDHILLSQFSRLPQPGRPGPRIYIPQERGGPDIPPGTGFPFRCLLRLAELRWRYSIPPPQGGKLTDLITEPITIYGYKEITHIINIHKRSKFLCYLSKDAQYVFAKIWFYFFYFFSLRRFSLL